jgi:hypothetical protein
MKLRIGILLCAGLLLGSTALAQPVTPTIHRPHLMTVKGRTSTFDCGGNCASGINSEPGIAIRSTRTERRYFCVSVGKNRTVLRQVDWGPASWTGRAIDITGSGAHKLHLPSGNAYPTGKYGKARLLPHNRRLWGRC